MPRLVSSGDCAGALDVMDDLRRLMDGQELMGATPPSNSSFLPHTHHPTMHQLVSSGDCAGTLDVMDDLRRLMERQELMGATLPSNSFLPPHAPPYRPSAGIIGRLCGRARRDGRLKAPHGWAGARRAALLPPPQPPPGVLLRCRQQVSLSFSHSSHSRLPLSHPPLPPTLISLSALLPPPQPPPPHLLRCRLQVGRSLSLFPLLPPTRISPHSPPPWRGCTASATSTTSSSPPPIF
ncbi:unnamed protein product [Closterium sp. Yama58-4]|nr:unnamed protein product [Closterium sp. Yama58-4]